LSFYGTPKVFELLLVGFLLLWLKTTQNNQLKKRKAFF
jgi:hypothetical protein